MGHILRTIYLPMVFVLTSLLAYVSSAPIQAAVKLPAFQIKQSTPGAGPPRIKSDILRPPTQCSLRVVEWSGVGDSCASSKSDLSVVTDVNEQTPSGYLQRLDVPLKTPKAPALHAAVRLRLLRVNIFKGMRVFEACVHKRGRYPCSNEMPAMLTEWYTICDDVWRKQMGVYHQDGSLVEVVGVDVGV
ncbi:hypothetical protein BDY19DRAFT_903218 [Irpex rosettiformis]|uniref:Uncharacterized protein n=1 Tax=Irpex rosettiformis TaxID=378272 RepID=A0ACB8UGE0_9APHY|nr:hypothetical protein BDY19DRAFT_903218 [Irpex rosettiformis]